MKNIIQILVLCFFSFSTSLIENRGFETGNGDKANGWISSTWGGAHAVHKRISKTGASGKYSYFLEKKSSKGGLQLYHKKIIELPGNGKPVTINCKYKGNKGKVRVIVRFFEKESGKFKVLKNSLNKGVVFSFALNPSLKWNNFSKNIKIPELVTKQDTFGMRIYFLVLNIDKIYVDDLYLTADIEKVASSRGGNKYTGREDIDKQNHIENSGFEKGKDENASGWSCNSWGGKNIVKQRTASECASGNYSFFMEKKFSGGGMNLAYNGYIILQDFQKNSYEIDLSVKHMKNIKDVLLQLKFYVKEKNKTVSLKTENGKKFYINLYLVPERKRHFLKI